MFALGGAGWFGRKYTAQKLVASDVVSEIVIGGRNMEAAKRTAAELGDKATALQVDATDEGDLASLAADSDIIVNTAGPDFKVALPAVRGAIRAGVNYCDLSIDGPTTEKALALDGAAKAAGVTALVGIGWQPGLSNLIMMHAAHQLDQADEIRWCWLFPISGWGDPKTVLAEWRRVGHADGSWQQMMRWAAARARLYRGGRWVDVDPVEDSVRISFPLGGEVTAHPVGNPIPITLPPALPGVRSVSYVLSLFPPQLNQLYYDQGRRVAMGELDESGAAISFYESVVAQPDRWLTAPEGFDPRWVEWAKAVGAWAEAVGTQQGRRVRYRCWPNGSWFGTSDPLATATLKILRGEIRTRGILTPESCLDPVSFLAEAAQSATEKPPEGKLLADSFEVLE